MQRGAWGWACILFTCYHACDNTDGKHARRTGKSSKFGHVLDHAVDATAGVTAITLIFEQVHTPCVHHASAMHICRRVSPRGRGQGLQPAPSLRTLPTPAAHLC